MSRHAIRLLVAGALVLHTGLTIRAQVVRQPWWAVDRRPVAAISLWNSSYLDRGDPEDDRGLQECWRRGSLEAKDRCGGLGGVAWLVSELQRRYALGYRRFMLVLPAGRPNHFGEPEGFPSAQWHLLDKVGIETQRGSSSVRQDLASLLTPWLRDRPGAEVYIYQGLRYNPLSAEPWKDDEMSGSIPPDLDTEFGRRVVRENTLGWLALAPTTVPPRPNPRAIGFVFDNTGLPGTRGALVDVVQQSQMLFGKRIFVGGEAIPHTLDPDNEEQPGEILEDYWLVAPWFATMRVHRALDPNEHWIAPFGTMLAFGIHNHECRWETLEPGAVCDADHEYAPQEIRAAIQSAHERGFVIFHYGGDYDADVLALTH